MAKQELELVRFDRITTPSGPQGAQKTPTLRMTGAGNFTLNHALVALMSLKVGAGVALLQDKNEEGDWYLVRDDKDGFVLRDGKVGTLQFNSSSLRASIAKGFGEDDASGGMVISQEVVKQGPHLLYPVITSTLAQRKRRKKD